MRELLGLRVVLVAMKRRDLPIASPCTVEWDTMTPRGRNMFCNDCKTVVHDLSKMRRLEAVEFLRSRVNDQLCVKYSHDVMGNVQFADTSTATVIPANMLRPSVRALAAATAIVGASALYPRSSAAPPVTVAPAESSDVVGSGDSSAVPQNAPTPQPSFEPEFTLGSARYGMLDTRNVHWPHDINGISKRGRSHMPTLKVGRPKVPNGGYSAAVVQRYVKRNHAKLSYCYEKQLLVNPFLNGSVTVTFDIASYGAAADIVATGVDPTVDTCVAAVLKGIEFPKAKATVEDVKVILTLKSGR